MNRRLVLLLLERPQFAAPGSTTSGDKEQCGAEG